LSFSAAPTLSAAAQLVNFDFNGHRDNEAPSSTYSGLGPVGGTFIGIDANSSFPAPNNDNLTVAGGPVSGISFVITPVGADTIAGPASDVIFEDYVFVHSAGNNADATLTITGILGPTADLYFYNGSTEVVVTIAGQTSDALPAVNAPFAAGNTLFFDDVPVTAGSIVATLGTGSLTTLGGFTVQSVPEPASIALLGLGAMSLLLFARRKA
jgi:hypothetical protein